MAQGFQRFGQLGQLQRHGAGDAGAGARRVECQRVGPQQGQTAADGGVGQVGQPNAVAARVGKGRVGAARAGEFGVQLDHMADIDHHHEGRPAFGGGQGAGVVLGLAAGAQQGVVEALGGLALVGIGTGVELLAFEHEGAAAVAIHPARALTAVAVAKGDGPLEHVALIGRGVRARHGQQVAQLDDKALRGRQLRCGAALPAGDEVAGDLGWRISWGVHARDDRQRLAGRRWEPRGAAGCLPLPSGAFRCRQAASGGVSAPRPAAARSPPPGCGCGR